MKRRGGVHEEFSCARIQCCHSKRTFVISIEEGRGFEIKNGARTMKRK
jgi:hypothetical protein